MTSTATSAAPPRLLDGLADLRVLGAVLPHPPAAEQGALRQCSRALKTYVDDTCDLALHQVRLQRALRGPEGPNGRGAALLAGAGLYL